MEGGLEEVVSVPLLYQGVEAIEGIVVTGVDMEDMEDIEDINRSGLAKKEVEKRQQN